MDRLPTSGLPKITARNYQSRTDAERREDARAKPPVFANAS
jgi:hypothetical protein